MNKTKLTKVLTLLAVLVLLTATLAGCTGRKQVVRTLESGNVVTFNKTDDNGGLILDEKGQPVSANNLTADQIKLIANMLVVAFDANTYDVQAWLVAASRGHNMMDPNFDPNGAEASQIKPADMDVARWVIKSANEKVKDSAKVDGAFWNMNEYDLTSLINALKTDVSTEKDSGILGTIQGWIGVALNWITRYLCFDSYLLGICFFAVIVEILMLPFAIKQQKNSIKQAKLRPKEMAIRKKYAGRTDQATMQKMQQEIQEFYQKENFSPFSGCMPLLIQMPIVLVLYNIVIDPLTNGLGQSAAVSSALRTFYTTAKAAGGMGGTLGNNSSTITLLSRLREEGAGAFEALKSFQFFVNSEDLYAGLAPMIDEIPNFSVFNINLGLSPQDMLWPLVLVPIFTFATYFLTSKLNRKFMYQPAANAGADDKQTACSNSIMDITMPAMSTVFTFMVPSLIGVYWVFRSLVGLLKQFILSRVMPLPKFTEEDYKAAAKEMAGKRPVQKSENVGKVRSLHYIDDEDFEDTRARGAARRAALEEQEKATAEEKDKKSKSGVEAAPVKDDEHKKDNE